MSALTVSPSDMSGDGHSSLLALVTFGMDSPTNPKMTIRQTYFPSGIKDRERDLSFLENLQSICYPDGIKT